IEAEIAESANRDFGIRSVDGYATSIVMCERNDVVHVSEARKNLLLDASHGIVHGCGNALHSGGDAEDVLCADGTAVIKEALERVALKRRERLRHGSRERKRIQGGRAGKAHLLLMYPASFCNLSLGEPDDGAVTNDRVAGMYMAECNLVRLGDVFREHQSRIKLRPGAQAALIHHDGDVIVGVNLNIQRT